MPYKVIQFATGHVGRLALQGILDHPDLELVGLWVHSADKAGRDAGELCGRAPVGVAATNDFDEILALDADAVSHNSTGDLRPAEAAAEMAALLASGKNVVSSAANGSFAAAVAVVGAAASSASATTATTAPRRQRTFTPPV